MGIDTNSEEVSPPVTPDHKSAQRRLKSKIGHSPKLTSAVTGRRPGGFSCPTSGGPPKAATDFRLFDLKKSKKEPEAIFNTADAVTPQRGESGQLLLRVHTGFLLADLV